MKKTNLKEFNALLSKRKHSKNGVEYVNLYLQVRLNNGEVVEFEIKPKWFSAKFDFKLKENINEVK